MYKQLCNQIFNNRTSLVQPSCCKAKALYKLTFKFASDKKTVAVLNADYLWQSFSFCSMHKFHDPIWSFIWNANVAYLDKNDAFHVTLLKLTEQSVPNIMLAVFLVEGNCVLISLIYIWRIRIQWLVWYNIPHWTYNIN